MKQPQDFFNTYLSVYRPLTNITNQLLEKYGLSSSYWRLLRVLENGEIKNFSDITHMLQVEKPAITKIIKKLAEYKFVEITSGQDKREKMVRLTSYGVEQMREIRKELNPFLCATLQGIDEAKLESAMEVLEKIHENMMKY